MTTHTIVWIILVIVAIHAFCDVILGWRRP